MSACIRRGDEFLCTTNARMRWGRLDKNLNSLATFPDIEAAHDFMDDCQTIEFGDDCYADPIHFGTHGSKST